MNILLIGSGGREHALAWRLAQSGFIERLAARVASVEDAGQDAPAGEPASAAGTGNGSGT